MQAAAATPDPAGERRPIRTQARTDAAPQRVDGAAPRPARPSDSAAALLGLEREARQALTTAELGYLMVNGSRVALAFRQAMLVLRHGKGHRVEAVSSLSAVDRNATFVRWVEGLVARKVAGDNMAKIVSFDARRESAVGDLDASAYPFPRMALVPLALRDGTVFAHLLLTREQPWEEDALVAAARLCEAYAHAWEALTGPGKIKRRMRSRTALLLAAGTALAVAGFLPVPLTVLAPAEVTAAKPFVVAAPIDGVVRTVAVKPNMRVKEGEALFAYDDTELRNRLELAGQAVAVAGARYEQAERTSFADAKAKRELSLALSELKLKRAEYAYASELMAHTTVRAGESGLVIFSGSDEWTGRPVSTGERIMRIADPMRVELTVQVPVGDAIVLHEGARVRLYLDADPLNALDATLVSSAFHAAPDAAGVLAYKVKATFADGVAPPRIGLRGTAQIHGEDVSLFYFVFRKPLAAVRQWTGL